MTKAELVAALLTAPGPNFGLDKAIFMALYPKENRSILRYTLSYEDARKLLPLGWYACSAPQFRVFLGERIVRWDAQCLKPLWEKFTADENVLDATEVRNAATPELALCAAAVMIYMTEAERAEVVR